MSACLKILIRWIEKRNATFFSRLLLLLLLLFKRKAIEIKWFIFAIVVIHIVVGVECVCVCVCAAKMPAGFYLSFWQMTPTSKVICEKTHKQVVWCHSQLTHQAIARSLYCTYIFAPIDYGFLFSFSDVFFFVFHRVYMSILFVCISFGRSSQRQPSILETTVSSMSCFTWLSNSAGQKR